MKTSKMLMSIATIFFFVIIGCSSGGGEGGAFIPTFNATWAVEGTNGAYRMDLQPNEANKNVEMGVFPGEEQHDNDPDRDGNPLTGSFNGRNIEYTIQRGNHNNVKYSGIMIPVNEESGQIIRIELSSSEGNIVLVPL